MRHISKQPEPQALFDWKAQANADWQPAYELLSGAPKLALKLALMVEQGFICCYCERRLHDDDAHIEHFRPQSDPACDALDYANLLCSCQNRIERGAPRHCGNLKEDWFDEQLLVSPLLEGCERQFAFAGDGSIRPANPDDQSAAITIEKLGLNIRKLQDLRKAAIELFLDPELSDADLQLFTQAYLARDADNRLGEFCSTVAHLFGRDEPGVYGA